MEVACTGDGPGWTRMKHRFRWFLNMIAAHYSGPGGCSCRPGGSGRSLLPGSSAASNRPDNQSKQPQITQYEQIHSMSNSIQLVWTIFFWGGGLNGKNIIYQPIVHKCLKRLQIFVLHKHIPRVGCLLRQFFIPLGNPQKKSSFFSGHVH